MSDSTADRRCDHEFAQPGPYDQVLWCPKCDRKKWRSTGEFINDEPAPAFYHRRKDDPK